MEILDRLAVSLSCGTCGEPYVVPLSNVLASHELLRAGCPVDSTEECPPLAWAELGDEAELRRLAEIWRHLEERAAAAGGQLLLQDAPSS
jgi:hypothetical protein